MITWVFFSMARNWGILRGRSPRTTQGRLGQPSASSSRLLHPTVNRAHSVILVVLESHTTVVDWQSNVGGQRMIRVDMKGEDRNIPEYSAVDLDELAKGIVDMAMNRSVL